MPIHLMNQIRQCVMDTPMTGSFVRCVGVLHLLCVLNTLSGQHSQHGEIGN